MMKESFKNIKDNYSKENPKETKKLESMREIIHKSVARVASDNSRKHVPVYGWTTMNYPSTIQIPLSEKYKNQEIEKQQERKALNKSSSNAVLANINNDNFSSEIMEDDFKKKHRDRVQPQRVNEEIMNEIENLIEIDHTKKFMQNYKKSDLNFFKTNFSNYEKSKNNIVVDSSVPHNYAKVIDIWSKSYLYELGYKKAFVIMTTNSQEDKAKYIDANLIFDKKYCTMYPKSNILGPEPDKNFSQKTKKIGDISFEEENHEIENVKNLSRLPPDNITEEWVKTNLNSGVELLRLENCYWLSKDLISKIGRIDQRLKELSLRNLDIDNMILSSIVKWAKNIEVLDISYCNGLTAGICEILSSSCKSLRFLKAYSLVKAINDPGLENLSYIETLTELEIGLCSQITDEGLIYFSTNKIQVMTNLDITGLIKISNKGISHILSNNNKSLIKLTLSLLAQKEVNGGICAEITKCKKLIHLDISGCININNDSAGNLFSAGLMNLESLNMSGLKIDNSVAEATFSSNKYLKILRLSNCIDLTFVFLDAILNNKNNLLLLEINRTKKIDEAKFLDFLEKKSINLRVIRACNEVWDIKNNGLKVPLKAIGYEKPLIKGAKKPVKKNDEKNPENQLNKLLEERKPKRILDFKI